MPSRETVSRFVGMVERGEFLEAIQEFYADDAMQENMNPPRNGMAALLENERKALSSFGAPPVTRAESFAVDGERVAINWVFEYSDVKGRRRRLDEIAYQLWRDDKIVKERFFYDPASVAAD